MSDPSLVIDDLTVRFGGVRALNSLSFAAEHRAVMAVIGPNGAGKSTLLNAISGLVRGNAVGSVLIHSTEVVGMHPARVARLGVGRSFQDPRLVDSSTVLDNVMLGGYLKFSYTMADQVFRRRHVAAREESLRQAADEMLTIANLAHLRARQVGGLPYGARKLIDIARAVVCADRLLLLDEPTSGLDVNEQHAVADMITAIHTRYDQLSILLVEHHMDIVRKIATEVVGLQAGTVLAKGSPREVLDSQEFQAALVGGNSKDHQRVYGAEPMTRASREQRGFTNKDGEQ